MARIRDTAPVNCRGFVIFEVRHAKRAKGDRRAALVAPGGASRPARFMRRRTRPGDPEVTWHLA
ncbi:MAG: hypothetical protein CR217_03970 [Beijerinckiaceae bacterium]|nr:MAG: hypothetical protein CR217_03970 [Beijerinckiaceae bacterium]